MLLSFFLILSFIGLKVIGKFLNEFTILNKYGISLREPVRRENCLSPSWHKPKDDYRALKTHTIFDGSVKGGKIVMSVKFFNHLIPHIVMLFIPTQSRINLSIPEYLSL